MSFLASRPQPASESDVLAGTENGKMITPFNIQYVKHDVELLYTASASAASDIQVNSIITSEHRHYRVVLDGIKTTINGDELLMEVSLDNGSSFVSGTGQYTGVLHSFIGYPSPTEDNIGSTDKLRLFSYTSGTDLDTADNANGELMLIDPLGTTNRTSVRGSFTQYDPIRVVSTEVHGWYSGSTSAVNAFRLFFEDGNITANIKVYGYR